jgi:hypothetical protein
VRGERGEIQINYNKQLDIYTFKKKSHFLSYKQTKNCGVIYNKKNYRGETERDR